LQTINNGKSIININSKDLHNSIQESDERMNLIAESMPGQDNKSTNVGLAKIHMIKSTRKASIVLKIDNKEEIKAKQPQVP
jgi:hypothetical protein